MGRMNITKVSDFILMGLTDSEEIRLALFTLFLLMHLPLLGNAGMMLIISLDLQLHTPMYFFLINLSFLDLSFSTTVTPKALDNLLTSNRYISYLNCFIQMNCAVFVGVTECVLLSSMACDRYAAICKPLHYPAIVSTRRCCSLVFGSFLIGLMDTFVNVLCLSKLHFCDSTVIYHFFCDAPPVLALSCTDTHDTEIIIFISAGSTLVGSLVTISVSCVSILSAILKITPTAGKRGDFSACASHLLAVTIFYDCSLRKTKSVLLFGKGSSSFCFLQYCHPMLNPLIHSLRNKEVKNALSRVLQKRKSSKQ